MIQRLSVSFKYCIFLSVTLVLRLKMALIIGHSQTKYFDNYIDSNDNVKVFCDSGCSVKNLLSNEVTAAIPNASVSINLILSHYILHNCSNLDTWGKGHNTFLCSTLLSMNIKQLINIEIAIQWKFNV